MLAATKLLFGPTTMTKAPLLAFSRNYAIKFKKTSFSPSISPMLEGCDVPSPPYSVLFFGTDRFSLPVLKMLHRASASVSHNNIVTDLEVVTLTPNCDELNDIKFRVIPRKQFKNFIPWRPFDLAAVASFGAMIPSKCIEHFDVAALNVHPSLLPQYRGAAPIQRALLNCEHVTGVTILEVSPRKFDEGKILAQQSVNILPSFNYKSLLADLSFRGATLLEDTIRALPFYMTKAIQQPSGEFNLARKIQPEDGTLDWANSTPIEIFNKWRAVGCMVPLEAKYRSYSFGLRDVFLPLSLELDNAGYDLGRKAKKKSSLQTPEKNLDILSPPDGGIGGEVRWWPEHQSLLVWCNANSPCNNLRAPRETQPGWVAVRTVLNNDKTMTAQEFCREIFGLRGDELAIKARFL